MFFVAVMFISHEKYFVEDFRLLIVLGNGSNCINTSCERKLELISFPICFN